MRTCIFVDGENFRYSIGDLFDPKSSRFPETKILSSPFKRDDYLPKNAEWGDFFDYISENSSPGNSQRIRTYWYVVNEVNSWPPLLTKRAENEQDEKIGKWRARNQNSIIKHGMDDDSTESIMEKLRKRKYLIESKFGGFRTIHRGITNKHKAVEFRYSGEISYDLFSRKLGTEKTVDVNLAVDMLQMRDIYDTAVIISGDQDYLPAVQAVKNAGKTVVNVAFSANGVLLPGGAKRLNECTDWSLTVDYRTFAQYLGLLKEKAPSAG